MPDSVKVIGQYCFYDNRELKTVKLSNNLEKICEQAFGGDYEAWTAEQQDWYDEMQYRMGHIEEVQSHEPGETNMTYEEAETIALAKIREEYGKDLPLEDQSLWRVSYSFRKGSEGESEDHWVFTLWI